MYEAFYRKWRSRRFEDIVSQQHITGTLQRQVALGRTAHAYIFTGSRGTGKTSCARILAKAVNCLSAENGSPCLKCSICQDSEAFRLSDIVEIDAASNNGINDIRDLRDGAVFTPERCRFKVYIIDEVHMLSTSAFNGLLKLMEEPPHFVKFILATTEIHKVPATILSRCQRFDFHRIDPHDIALHLIKISELEKIQLDKEAADLIAGVADGGMRDALSLLDQCVAFSQEVTPEIVSMAAGIAGREPLFQLLGFILMDELPKSLQLIDELYHMSKDMTRLCEELIWQTRNLMLIKSAPQQAKLLPLSAKEIEYLENISKELNLTDILKKMSALQECYNRMARALNQRVELEMCLVRMHLDSSARSSATPQNSTAISGVDNSQIYDKLKQLEAVVKNMSSSPQSQSTLPDRAAAVATTTAAVPTQPPQHQPAKKNNPGTGALKAEDFKACEAWPEVLEEFSKINPAVSSTLDGSRAFVAGNMLLLSVPNRLFTDLFKKNENALSLNQVIERVLGQKYVVRAKCDLPREDESTPMKSLINKAQENGLTVVVN